MVTKHPSPDAIAKFAQGRLSLAEAARWEQHFVVCDECGQKLAQVGNDNLIDLLKQASTRDETACTMETSATFPELPMELRNHSRYAIQKRLGRGGMGMVYHAMHRLMNRQVALKMIRSDLLATPLAVSRFRREVQAAAQLDHANIVTAFDAEEVSGIHFLVMEYVEGRSLDQLVDQKGPLAIPVAVSIARQIAQGLHHAHSLGMIHRDIKPNNVMITRQGKIKILDFGLARWSGRSNEKTLPQITATGSHLGTLMYAAPEQRKSAGEVDARADVYSLGATLVYLLTGKPPPLKMVEGITEDLTLPTDVPLELQAVIQRMLMPLPADRYPSAKTVVDALTPYSSSNLSPVVTSQTKGLRYALMVAIALVLVMMGLLLENLFRNRGNHPATQATELAATTPVRANPPVTLPIETSPLPKTVPPPKVEQLEDTWQSLLPLINPRRDRVAGNWSFVNEELTVGPSRGARLIIPIQVPAEYDLRITFTRRTGRNSIGAILMHGGKQCTMELDAWEQHLAGFQNVDGKSMLDNPTRREGVALENNRRYTLLMEVRAESIRALLEGQEVSRYVGDGKNLSVDASYWAVPSNTTLGLLSWESWTTFHAVELRRK